MLGISSLSSIARFTPALRSYALRQSYAETVTAALTDAGVPCAEWSRILSTDGAINAIAAGVLETVTAALTDAGVPCAE